MLAQFIEQNNVYVCIINVEVPRAVKNQHT